MYQKYFKRPLDIVAALGVFFCLWWLFLVLAFLVRYKLGSPILFAQKRPGKDGKVFTLYKFRTMTDERDACGTLLSDEVRLTTFGKWLRSTSLDEIPEFWNILKGDMSLVGPRPLLIEYLPLYSEEQKKRHNVLPGITGWAQINGRNAITWEQKFKYDVFYTKNISLLLDIKIVCLTIKQVLIRDGISAKGEATMPFFRGH